MINNVVQLNLTNANLASPSKPLVTSQMLSNPLVIKPEQLQRLQILASPVDLRKDLHQFLKYVDQHGIKRSHRNNEIPKSDEQRLSKLMSSKEGGSGYWCDSWADYVSHVARTMGIVSFATKGVYLGYTSQCASYPDNHIKIRKDAWKQFLSKTPAQKERALLDVLIAMTENEFFTPATIVKSKSFDSWGCATGPASRMKLAKIRHDLLNLLLHLKPDVWYTTSYFVELLRQAAPHLILDPSTRSNEDIYANFREHKPGDEYRSKPRQIASNQTDAFERVEGRYVEYFLREIPFLLGFVDLAFRPDSDKTGLEVAPPLGRLFGFRLSRRFFTAFGADSSEIDAVKTTVLPNFEVIIEALSYPEVVLESLLPYSISIKEESPIYRLKLDRKKVIDATAASPASDTKPIDDFLKELSGSQLPANVAAELASWTSLAEKVTLFEKVALIELRGDSQQRERVLHDLGDLVVDRRLQNFLVVKEPERAFSCLETKEHIPARVVHGADGFSVCEGAFAPPKGSAQSAQAKKAAVKQPEKVTMDVQDVVCYKVQHKPFLAALKEQFAQKAEHEVCVVQGDLLVLSASLLPQLRSALRKLSGKFDVANS